MKLQGMHIACLVLGLIGGFILSEALRPAAPAPGPGIQKDVSQAKAQEQPPANKAPQPPKSPAIATTPPVAKPVQPPLIAEGAIARPGLETAAVTPPAATDGPLPCIAVETDKFDTGVVPNDTKTVKTVKISNTGEGPLIIKSAKADCGCVAADVKDKTVPPHGSTDLTITIDPKKIHGFESKKRITITSNDPKYQKYVIEVTARIDPEFALEPENIDLGQIDKGQPVEGSQILRQLGAAPIEVTGVKPWGAIEGLDLSFEKIPQAEWRQQDRPEFRILAKISSDVSPGQFLGRFKIETTCQRLPQYSSFVKATVKAFYSIRPPSVVLHNSGVLTNQQPLRPPQVLIEADRAFELTDVAPSNPAILVTSHPGDTPNTVVLDLSLSPDAQPGNYNERVTFNIKAGDEVQRDRVNVRLLVRKPPSEPGAPGVGHNMAIPQGQVLASPPPNPASPSPPAAPAAAAGAPAPAPGTIAPVGSGNP